MKACGGDPQSRYSEIQKYEKSETEKYREWKNTECKIQIGGARSGARYDSVCQGNQTSHDTATSSFKEAPCNRVQCITKDLSEVQTCNDFCGKCNV